MREIKVSYADRVAHSVRPARLSSILDMIKNEKYKGLINVSRKRYVPGYEDRAKLAKQSLPILCAGDFAPADKAHQTNRRIAKFVSAECVIVDIDHIASADEAATPDLPDAIASLYASLSDDEDDNSWSPKYVYAAFRSPSGDGVKLVFALDTPCTDPDEYAALFLYISDKIYSDYGIRADLSCRDASRATFISSDPHLYINPDAKSVELSELRDELAKTDAIEADTSIELRSPDQSNMFIDIARFLRVEHYKQFRDLCSAASRMGAEVLSQFYDALLSANGGYLSDETRRALDKRDVYIKSFMGEHNRVPLQYIVEYATGQGFDFSAYAEKNKPTMFNVSALYKEVVAWMNQRFALFSYGDGIVRIPPAGLQTIDMLNEKNSARNGDYSIKKVASVREYLRNKNLRIMDGKGIVKHKNYYDIWSTSLNRRTASSIICDPRKNPGLSDRTGVLNEWRGMNVDLSKMQSVLEWEKEHDQLACEPILDFLFSNIANGNDQDYDIILHWCSEMIQNAGAVNKSSICLCLVSEQEGTGKGTFDAFMRDIVGPNHSALVGDISLVTGNFNQVLQGKLLITLDEAVHSGDRRQVAALKYLIGSDDLNIHPKFLNPFSIPNILRFLILSNSLHVAHISESNRRFYVVEVSKKRTGDRGYFGELRDCWSRRGGKESFYNYIRTRKIDMDLDIRGLDKSRIQKLNISSSWSPLETWVARLLRAGAIFDCRVHGAPPVRVQIFYFKSTVISYDALYSDYESYCRQIGGSRYDLSDSSFRAALIQKGIMSNTPGIVSELGRNGYVTEYRVTIAPLSELWEKYPLYIDGLVMPNNDNVMGEDTDGF